MLLISRLYTNKLTGITKTRHEWLREYTREGLYNFSGRGGLFQRAHRIVKNNINYGVLVEVK